MNLFFNHQRDQQNREILKQKEMRATKERTLHQAEIKKRTIKPSDLPLVDIYLDKEDPSPVARGFNIDGNTLTLAWKEAPPEKIYINGKTQWLVSKNAVKEGPVIYADKTFEKLPIITALEKGSYELQLVTFPEDKDVQTYFGELKEGVLSLPFGPITNNAIAFQKTESRWLPMGLYESKGGLFVQLQNLPALTSLVQSFSRELQPTFQEKEQKFYVLENAYQQLVFSNVGGALVEINLPFKSESNPYSVVKEIGFDREIAKNDPINARFPLHPYYTPDSAEEHTAGPIGGYYPLLRRGIQTNKQTVEISPENYAFNIVSDYPEMAKLVYKVKEFAPNKIVFEAMQPHRRITKTFSITEGGRGAPYSLDLTIDVQGDSRGLWITSGVPEVEIMSNSSSPLIQYRLTRKGKAEVEKLDLPKPKEMVSMSSSL